jgi:shikimate dehydrogenase
VRLAVVGDPIGHSLSPTLHTVAFAAVGIPGTYEARAVDAAGFLGVLDEIRSGELDGVNVTMPHKRLAATQVDELAPQATRSGAVNTIVRIGRRLVGHNTDVAGVTISAQWAALPDTAPVLVLGAGGAAAAAVLAFEGRDLHVAARRPEAAESLLVATGVDGRTLPWGTPLGDAVVINATPIGMHGEALPEPVTAQAAGLLDMAYGSGSTPATLAVRTRGLPVAEGPDMLLAQAAEAFRLWTGAEPPVRVMRAAMHAALAER